MNIVQLVAIDTHVHAEVSCCQPPDLFAKDFDEAADKYFRTVLRQGRRPTIPETIEHYRERKIGFVMSTVDCEANIGRRRIANEEIADFAQQNADIMIAFASIDLHKDKLGARKARRLIEDHGVRGFKFHPTMQGFLPMIGWRIRYTK